MYCFNGEHLKVKKGKIQEMSPSLWLKRSTETGLASQKHPHGGVTGQMRNLRPNRLVDLLRRSCENPENDQKAFGVL